MEIKKNARHHERRQVTNPKTDPKINELILNLPVEKVEKYPDWWDTLLWIKKTFGEEYKEEARTLSKKSSKNGNMFDETWDKIKVTNSKTNCLDEIVSPANDFFELFCDNVVVNNYEGKNEVYCYCEKSKLWKRDDKLCLIKFNLGKLLNKKYSMDLIDESSDGIRKTKLEL